MSPVFAGCLYFCGDGFSCTVSCDGGGLFTVPDPLATQVRHQVSIETWSTEDYDYDDYQPKSDFPNVGVNDLSNSEEPDIFTMDLKSIEEPKLEVIVCDYYNEDQLYCKKL